MLLGNLDLSKCTPHTGTEQPLGLGWLRVPCKAGDVRRMRVSGLGLRVWGLGLRAEGLGLC